MSQKTYVLLPKILLNIENGGVYRQMVRCGKHNCKCMTRNERHEAFYLMTRICGKQVKIYVPADDVGQIRSILEKTKRRKSEQDIEHSKSFIVFRSFTEQLRINQTANRTNPK